MAALICLAIGFTTGIGFLFSALFYRGELIGVGTRVTGALICVGLGLFGAAVIGGFRLIGL